MWREALSVIPIQKRDPQRFSYPAQLKNSYKNYSRILKKAENVAHFDYLSQANNSWIFTLKTCEKSDFMRFSLILNGIIGMCEPFTPNSQKH